MRGNLSTKDSFHHQYSRTTSMRGHFSTKEGLHMVLYLARTYTRTSAMSTDATRQQYLPGRRRGIADIRLTVPIPWCRRGEASVSIGMDLGPLRRVLSGRVNCRSVLDPVKNALTWFRVTLLAWLSLLTPHNLKAQATYLAGKSPLELVLGAWHLIFNSGYFVGWLLYKVSRTFVRLVLVLMGGEVLQQPEEEEVDKSEVLFKPAALPAPMPTAATPAEPLALDAVPVEGAEAPQGEGAEGTEAAASATSEDQTESSRVDRIRVPEPVWICPGRRWRGRSSPRGRNGRPDSQGGRTPSRVSPTSPTPGLRQPTTVCDRVIEEVEEKSFAVEVVKTTEPPPAVASLDFSEYGQKLVSFLARKFYTMKWIALLIAFIINFMLLFYKVSSGRRP
ncbi:RYR2 [Cordylochernes scorpioides]|uniref:RYR2 n=1 Tax=Cordylochernes scorpioides TaxID=51811 RepID=A0ABY6K6X6_9ARAC|nr:RYR2 [Cordylochernes scorpioides]